MLILQRHQSRFTQLLLGGDLNVEFGNFDSSPALRRVLGPFTRGAGDDRAATFLKLTQRLAAT